ncbi:MAG: hypothetical protein RLZZ196_3393 [Bacteroidota bacterium]|jgi:hypothetical protein
MDENINLIKQLFNSLKIESLKDQNFLEHFLIPHLGLNNEMLIEQPPELNEFYGTGLKLKIWQYPNQFSKYMIQLCSYADKINSYLEIGCRHGGTYILTTEFLKCINKNFSKSVAIDIIDPNESLKIYTSCTDGVEFKNINSGSSDFKNYISNNFFDLIFIDGDHSYEFVKNDAEITRDFCNIQVFHDIVNDACPGVGVYWNEIKDSYSRIYNFYDFIDQYDSVSGTYLGIGMAVRKKWITI